MFGEILQKFAEKSPVTVMVQGLLECLLDSEKIDRWFDSTCQTQYTKEILFSSLVFLMLNVVCRIRSSVHCVYRNSGKIKNSVVAVYDKLKRMEPATSAGIVRHIAGEAELIIREMKGTHLSWLPGYKVKLLDGNCIEATEHRLEVLRETTAGALPGKSSVVFDPETELAIDVFPCEDAYTQERALLGEVLKTVQPTDLWIADCNFCVQNFLWGIHDKNAFFVIRQHQNTPYKPLSEKKLMGKSETGLVFEQSILLSSADGKTFQARRIIVQLHHPTRNGANEIATFTNLPVKDADALKVATLYRNRWGIETAFQRLEKHFNSEINTLGYPKAALFGFCLALVAFNLYAVVRAAVRATHPDPAIDDEISDYYIAEEIAATYTGMVIIVPDEEWGPFRTGSLQDVKNALIDLALRMDLRKFKKNKRGPKKPSNPKTKFKGQPHVSTARLLAGQD
jgi:hypothetical protein